MHPHYSAIYLMLPEKQQEQKKKHVSLPEKRWKDPLPVKSKQNFD